MEYIGFLISLLALIYLFFKQKSIARYRQEHPESFSDQEDVEDDSMTEFIKAIGIEDQRKAIVKLAPPAPPKQAKAMRKGAASPLEHYRLESSVEKRQLKSPLEKRQLKPSVKRPMEETSPQILLTPLHLSDAIVVEPSRAEVAIRRLAHRKDLLIYLEIIDKPKSMRPSP